MTTKQIPCQFFFSAWNQRLVEMPGELGGLDAPTRCVESAECPDVAHPDSGAPPGRIERIILIGVTVDTTIINELARKLIDAMPGSAESLDTMRGDLEKNFRGLLAAAFERMDLVTREEFDIQRKVLERSREKLAALEAEVEKLEADHQPAPDDTANQR
jgi:BMFP domain-containing protein YqiC